MQTWAGSIFKWIADSIAYHCCSVSGILDFIAIMISDVFAAISATFHVFLSVIPSATSIIQIERHQNAGDSRDHQHRGYAFSGDQFAFYTDE